MPIDNRKGAFVRDFRNATETEYLKAVTQWEIKKATSQQTDNKQNKSRSYSKAAQTFEEQNVDFLTLNELEHFACETSAALSSHGFLSRSGANIYIMMGVSALLTHVMLITTDSLKGIPMGALFQRLH